MTENERFGLVSVKTGSINSGTYQDITGTSFPNSLELHEFIDPRFRENQPKTLVFSHRKRAFWACFRENWVYNFGQIFQ
jgi:hypothetical protein